MVPILYSQQLPQPEEVVEVLTTDLLPKMAVLAAVVGLLVIPAQPPLVEQARLRRDSLEATLLLNQEQVAVALVLQVQQSHLEQPQALVATELPLQFQALCFITLAVEVDRARQVEQVEQVVAVVLPMEQLPTQLMAQ